MLNRLSVVVGLMMFVFCSLWSLLFAGAGLISVEWCRDYIGVCGLCTLLACGLISAYEVASEFVEDWRIWQQES